MITRASFNILGYIIYSVEVEMPPWIEHLLSV